MKVVKKMSLKFIESQCIAINLSIYFKTTSQYQKQLSI